MRRKNKCLFLLFAIIIVAFSLLVVILFSGFLVFSSSLQLDINDVPIHSQRGVELNSVPQISCQPGKVSQFVISLRQNRGFTIPARGVEGRLELPMGFYSEDVSHILAQQQVIPFGSIYSGDASHCTSRVTVDNAVVPGVYYANFVYWGKNVQIHEIVIELIVNSS